MSKIQQGQRVEVANNFRVTPDLWGTRGTIEKSREDVSRDWRTDRVISRSTKYFVRFDEPTKSIGSLMTGVWLEQCMLKTV